MTQFLSLLPLLKEAAAAAQKSVAQGDSRENVEASVWQVVGPKVVKIEGKVLDHETKRAFCKFAAGTAICLRGD